PPWGISKRPTKEEIAMKSLIFPILLTCALTLTAFGQETNGSIKGTISDSKGAGVAGAALKLTNIATGAERSTTSSDSGTYDIQTLQPGTYSLSVEARGFSKAMVRDIVVSVGSAAVIPVVLEVGSP